MSFSESLDTLIESSGNLLLAKGSQWVRTPLRELASITNGYAFSSSGFNRDTGLPLIRIRDIDQESTEVLFGGDYDQNSLINHDDLVVGMDGDFKCALWRGKTALLNQRVCRIDVDQRFLSKHFLFYILPGYLNAIHAATSSITVKHLSSRTLEQLPVPLPPLSEQRRIVAEIEKQFTRLSQGEHLLLRLGAQLRKLQSAGIRAACSRFAGRAAEPFGAIIENIRNGISAKPSGDKGLEILKISAVRPFQLRLEERRFLPPNNEYDPFKLREGDLLFTRYNGNRKFVGVCACVRKLQRELLYPDKLIRVRLQGGHEPRFYELMFNVGPTREHIESRIRTTAGQSGISGTDLKNAPVPVATPEEQCAVVEQAETTLSAVEHLAGELEAANLRVARLRQAILAKAFSGQLVPQDSDDEPASVLLERIRAERGSCRPKRAVRRRAAGQLELTAQS